MRNLTDVEAKAQLLLSEIESAISTGAAVPWQIVIAANNVKKAFVAEDAQLGADLAAMAALNRKVSGSDIN